MKISLNWLKDYIEIPVSPDELSTILTSLGLEVEGVEKIEGVKGGLKGVVVGEIKSCIKHPNADRLSLTKVDIGDGRLLQIVCGAPNVATGQKVLVATEGTTLYPHSGDTLTIKKGKIRDEDSEGMICAADEMGLSDDHSGILVLDHSVDIGTHAADYFQLEDDVVYEIGLTPNRADAVCHIGVAKDLAAYWSYHQNKKFTVKIPKGLGVNSELKPNQITVEVLDPLGCPRYSGISFENLKVGESPKWIQNRLRSIGVRPISNVVDITNYILNEYGQPLHAFDQEKIEGQKIYVECLAEGSKFTTLDERERLLRSTDLMICDGGHNGMCLAGVFGGIKSGVTNSTSRVFLEAAHFDPIMLRKSSTAHNLRTDAVKVFEKGSDPNITIPALERAAYLLKEYAGAEISSNLTDIISNNISRAKIEVNSRQVNKLIGNPIESNDLERIFSALGFEILAHKNSIYEVLIPTNKPDVLREADVIEEVLRIYGFDNVEISNRISASINPQLWPSRGDIREAISKYLSSRTFKETMSLSLVPSKWYDIFQGFKANLVYINNTSNIHLNSMRPEMMFSMLSSVQYNLNRQNSDLALFEQGKSYAKTQLDGDFFEQDIISIVLSGSINKDDWRNKEMPVDFYDIKNSIHNVLGRLGINSFEVEELEDERFEFGLQYKLNGLVLANFGKISQKASDLFDLKTSVFYGELLLDSLVDNMSSSDVYVDEIPKYPSSRRDLALLIDDGVSYLQIEDVIKRNSGKILSDLVLFDVYKDKKHLGDNKKSYAVGLTFVDKDKSITDRSLDKIVANIISALKRELNAELR